MVRDLGELPFDGCDRLTGCRREWGGEEIRTLTGQVEFSPDGRRLLVTEKTTNVLLPPAKRHRLVQGPRRRPDELHTEANSVSWPSSLQPGIS